MKQLLLAVSISTLFAASFATAAFAEDDRDQAAGKHDMGPSPNSGANDFHSATDSKGAAPFKKSNSGAIKEQPKEQTR